MSRFIRTALAPCSVLLIGVSCAAATRDPLPSWNDGPARQAIVRFVESTTTPSSPDFVPAAERIAVFDNDGTLWPSHLMYTQLAFALDRIRQLAPEHPEWKTTQPFQAVLEDDLEALGAAGEKGIAELVMASHAGMSTADFEAVVKDWLEKARHPRFERPYTDLAYQPMLELLEYLRAHGFETFIVSGGGVEFMRPMTEAVYGIPPQQVVGSTIEMRYEVRDSEPVLMRLPKIDFVDDKTGKPIGINEFIGRRPLAAFGNSAGDREMLEWTGADRGARRMMLVFHDDAQREYAYGPANGPPSTKLGTFPQSLMDEAKTKSWVVISMKDDWKRIYSFEAPSPRHSGLDPGPFTGRCVSWTRSGDPPLTRDPRPARIEHRASGRRAAIALQREGASASSASRTRSESSLVSKGFRSRIAP